MSPLEMGAVVVGVPSTFHTPLSGHFSPVRAVVPSGADINSLLKAMSKFGLIKSFTIDDGELDGASPQQCFVLGYELSQVDHLLASKREIRQPVHADNRQRIEASCLDSGRPFQLNWMPGDISESWLLLEVPARHDRRAA